MELLKVPLQVLTCLDLTNNAVRADLSGEWAGIPQLSICVPRIRLTHARQLLSKPVDAAARHRDDVGSVGSVGSEYSVLVLDRERGGAGLRAGWRGERGAGP